MWRAGIIDVNFAETDLILQCVFFHFFCVVGFFFSHESIQSNKDVKLFKSLLIQEHCLKH